MTKPSPRIQQQLAKLERYIRQVPQKIRHLPADVLQHRPAKDKWSKKEILGHLIDSGTYNWQRFINIRFSEQPFLIQPYAQKELVIFNRYQQKPLQDLLGLWVQINQQIVRASEQLDEDSLRLKVEAPWNSYIEGDNDLAWLFNDYVAHMEHHLRQLFGSLEALESNEEWQYSIAQAQQQLEAQQEQRFVTLFERESLLIEWYAPEKVDLQSPHEQDELYIVASGNGIFYNNGRRAPFQTGDLLFVPAGVEHRFEDFSDDFKTWVIFYGPKGGESSTAATTIHRQIANKTYTISTAPERLDPTAIHQYLSRSYWAKGRSLEAVEQSLLHSFCFGLYHQDQQIGLARVITDFIGFAYLCDVYILEDHQGQGLGKWLLETVVKHERLSSIKNWLLFTDDAHTLYERFGFETISVDKLVMRWQRKK